MGDEVSNRIIIVLALLVIVVVAVSTWLTVSNLNTISAADSKVKMTEKIKEGPPAGGRVSLAILPAQKLGEAK